MLLNRIVRRFHLQVEVRGTVEGCKVLAAPSLAVVAEIEGALVMTSRWQEVVVLPR